MNSEDYTNNSEDDKFTDFDKYDLDPDKFHDYEEDTVSKQMKFFYPVVIIKREEEKRRRRERKKNTKLEK